MVRRWPGVNVRLFTETPVTHTHNNKTTTDEHTHTTHTTHTVNNERHAFFAVVGGATGKRGFDSEKKKKKKGLLATRRRLGRRGDSFALRSAFVV